MIKIILCLYRINKKLLASCLDSIRSQTYKDWTLIVIWDDERSEEVDFQDMNVRICNDHEHCGIARARNKGLDLCDPDDIVVYIDHDNTWYPDYLMAIADAFTDETVATVYTNMKYKNGDIVTSKGFDWDDVLHNNYIDLNVFAHRAFLARILGGFDTNLSRMVDWDLILRYTRHHPPRHLSIIGAEYDNGNEHTRLSYYNPMMINWYRIWKKWKPIRPFLSGFKILYIAHHYRHLSESYIDWEMEYFMRLGAIIEVYADNLHPAVPVPHNIKTHHNLMDAIRTFRPDHLHVHWMNIGLIHKHAIRQSGLPTTIRVHGFDWDPAMAIHLLRFLPNLKHIFVYRPSMVFDKKMLAIAVGMNPVLHYPDVVPHHDRRTVLRVAAGLPNKDIDFFLELADKYSDEFNFILCIIHCNHMEHYTDEILRRKTRCKVLVDVPRHEIPVIMRSAGIYLHTNKDDIVGQPISIVEAMACGCYILVRNHPDLIGIVHGCGNSYSSMDDAIRLLRETKTWTDLEWDQTRCRSIDHAYSHFIPERTFEYVARAIRTLKN